MLYSFAIQILVALTHIVTKLNALSWHTVPYSVHIALLKTTLSKHLLAQWAKTVVVIPTLTRVRGSSVLRNYRSVDSNVSSCVSVDRYR